MTAFEIYVNGRKSCTVGINEDGVVVPAITWARGGTKKKVEHIDFRVGGLISRTRTHIDWFYRQLKIGDEVKIVLVEKAKVDRPKKKRTESKSAREKRERDYVEKMAAKFGWKLTKSKPPKQALEPTIPGVTPRAEGKPRVAPPGIVAQLER